MTWQTDRAHTKIEFNARHMMLAKVRGEFGDYTVDLQLDPECPELASVEARIRTASVNTRDAQRDAHLRSADFFQSEELPETVFKSTKVKRTGEDTAKLHGDLTIRDVTRPFAPDVTRPFAPDVTYLGTSKSSWGTTSLGFEAEGKIDREDWGLTWNAALETGGWLVGRDITLNIDAEFVQQ